MKYSELQYERIDVEKRRNLMKEYLDKFSNAHSVDDQINVILDVNEQLHGLGCLRCFGTCFQSTDMFVCIRKIIDHP